MAVYDHSITYRKFKFRNIPHYFRLRKIISFLKNQKISGYKYIDIGCSNGYITNIIGSEFNFKEIKGVDHTLENLKHGSKQYPHINFEFIDLNKVKISEEKYNLVTCFETIEHVGNIENAITTILNFTEINNSAVFITVPIEIGFWGVSKFLIKSVIFNYKLRELHGNPTKWNYLKDLISGNDISKYRDSKKGWGTHFGFSYKELDRILISRNIPYKATNSFTTRLYYIQFR